MREEPYKFDQAVLKDFGGLKYKMTHFKVLRTSGVEVPKKKHNLTFERGEVNDEKLENNISRAKSTVLELAMCNQWDYWMTLTLEEEKKLKKAELFEVTDKIRDTKKKATDILKAISDLSYEVDEKYRRW